MNKWRKLLKRNSAYEVVEKYANYYKITLSEAFIKLKEDAI
mgnify:CR=1 FL=1